MVRDLKVRFCTFIQQTLDNVVKSLTEEQFKGLKFGTSEKLRDIEKCRITDSQNSVDPKNIWICDTD
jgi:hypothetical protein